MKRSFLNIILGSLYLLFLGACHRQLQDTKVKIRGKIVNPETDKVIFSKDFLMLQTDTLPLLAENEVKGHIKVPEEGLYVFYVFPEYQTIYLKSGDSLNFHLNVDEFDESLSFSGSLGFQNNLLMNLFLTNEKESSFFYRSNFDLNLKDFNQKLDSFEHIKTKIIESYRNEFKHTDQKFKEITHLLNKSMFYNLKEIYAQKHRQQKLPASYFDYENILHQRLADPNVIYLYAFADSFLERKIKQNVSKNENPYLKIATLIDREISDPDFKDNLLVKYCNRYIIGHLMTHKDKIVKTFFDKIQNRTYKIYCEKLIKKNQIMQTGHYFPKLDFYTAQKNIIVSDSLFKNKKILLSFWDLKYRKNFKSNLKKIKRYQSNHPEIQFIILNINPGDFDDWILQLPDNQNITFLKLKDNSYLQQIRPYHLSQVYLLQNNKIIKSMTNMYQVNFTKILDTFATKNN